MKSMCLGIIPNTHIVCGEGGNFCSDDCWGRAILDHIKSLLLREDAYATPFDTLRKIGIDSNLLSRK